MTADAATLPRLFAIETMRAAESSLREDAFLVHAANGAAPIRGIDWEEAHLLLGFNTSSLKPGAGPFVDGRANPPGSLALRAWARRRLASDAGPMAGMARLARLRQILGPGSPMLVHTRAKRPRRECPRGGDRLIVEADAVTPQGTFRNGLSVTIALVTPGAQPVSVAAEQIGPGFYRASLKKPETGDAVVAVSYEAGRPVSQAWTPDYPAEFQVLRDGKPLLKELSSMTGGKFDAKPEDILRPAKHSAATRSELAPWFLAAALLLLPVDIWLRRREWSTGGGNSLSAFSGAH